MDWETEIHLIVHKMQFHRIKYKLMTITNDYRLMRRSDKVGFYFDNLTEGRWYIKSILTIGT